MKSLSLQPADDRIHSNVTLGIAPGESPLEWSVIFERHMVGASNSWHPATMHYSI